MGLTNFNIIFYDTPYIHNECGEYPNIFHRIMFFPLLWTWIILWGYFPYCLWKLYHSGRAYYFPLFKLPCVGPLNLVSFYLILRDIPMHFILQGRQTNHMHWRGETTCGWYYINDLIWIHSSNLYGFEVCLWMSSSMKKTWNILFHMCKSWCSTS